VPEDEGTPPEPPFRGSPLPPEDRLWRHPSEIRRASAGGHPRRKRSALSLGLAAGLGASLALMGAWGLGAFHREGADGQTASERLATPISTILVGAPSPGGMDEVAETLVHVRSGGIDGSGVVLRDDGHVLTTAELVGDAEEVRVRAVDGPELVGAVVGVDPATDVAVLLVQGLDHLGAVLGVARDLAVGDPARTIALQGRQAAEIVTGEVANLAVTVSRGDEEGPLHGLIGTDIVLEHPIEGAALIDATGAVIGITTSVGDSDAVRAVPIDLARTVARDIIATGGPAHPWLGIEGRDLEAEDAAQWGVRGGAELLDVVEDSPATEAGLHDADVVTQIGDTEVTSMGDLVTALRLLDPGDAVRIGYLRSGHHHWAGAVLGEPAAQ
jgi:putative serine protease PepD